jgi:hypothetical protein
MNQTQQFANELDKLVHRFRQEWELEYAQMVGVLTMKAFILMFESMEMEVDDDDGEESWK